MLQLDGVNVSVDGLAVPSVGVSLATPIETLLIGGDVSTTWNVAVCPDSLVTSPLVGVTTMCAGGGGIDTLRSNSVETPSTFGETTKRAVDDALAPFVKLTSLPVCVHCAESSHDVMRPRLRVNGLPFVAPVGDTKTVTVCWGSSVAS